MPTFRHWPEPTAAGGASAPRRVLIVDDSSETREVLRAALERRGLEILEAPAVERGLDLVRRYHPDVVVLDADVADAGDDSQRRACTSACAQDRSSLVVLGQWPDAPPASSLRVVRKPFHYEPLVRLITDLTERRRAA
ncbi:MAG: response regulator [Pirellulales bacterium]